MRAFTKPKRTDFYEYILLYVGGVLCISNKPRYVISRIDKFFKMQPGLIVKTGMYLDAKAIFSISEVNASFILHYLV